MLCTLYSQAPRSLCYIIYTKKHIDIPREINTCRIDPYVVANVYQVGLSLVVLFGVRDIFCKFRFVIASLTFQAMTFRCWDVRDIVCA